MPISSSAPSVIGRRDIVRFIIPVTIDNFATTSIGLLYSTLVGKISSSALAAVGLANSTVNVLISACAVMTTGSAILMARHVGGRDREEASRTIEQSILFTLVLAGLIAVLTIALAVPIMHLLIPTDDASIFRESVLYFRLLMISFPFLMIYNTLVSVLRGAGNSRAPLIASVLLNLVQIAVAYLCINILGLDLIGAGIAFIVCRVFGCGYMFLAALHSHDRFKIELRNLIKPRFDIFRRICRVGIPVSGESVFINSGYLIANSMVVGLGTYYASVYQIINTLQTFTNILHLICNATVLTLVGQFLGAGQPDKAQKCTVIVWFAGTGGTFLISLIVCLAGKALCGLYSTDAQVVADAAKNLWWVLAMSTVCVTTNVIDPALRAGGDTKFIMYNVFFAIWVVRLGLTYLLCYVLDWGIAGIYLGNLANLTERSIAGWIRFATGKWKKIKV
ncbi:MAG: MATE family efflux transporter [Oscillospiraceae bacterium]|nr:MATE family efflux transporter [Oscillospiraceae bacterium]